MSTLSTAQRIEAVLRTARSQEGYRAAPMKQSAFRATAGDWSGSFVAWALAENNVLSPSLDNTTAGLAWYTQHHRLFNRPRPGDIAFYGFTYNGEPGQPHCGLVSSTDGFTRNGVFYAFEGQTASGMPRDSGDLTGVFEHKRYRYDVIGFGRPEYRSWMNFPVVVPATVPTVRPSHFLPGLEVASSITAVQAALAMTVGLTDYNRGMYGGASRSAYAAWQRSAGFPGTGRPTVQDLIALGARTRLFNVRD